MADLRLGLVGCGRLAERGYVPAFRRAGGVRLSALADPDERRCRQLAGGRLPAYRDVGEMVVGGEAVDGVVVATPASAHLACAQAACDAGLPVLVEKPPAVTVDEAAQIAQLDPSPAFGFNRRFEPGMAALRRSTPAFDESELLLALHHRAGSWNSHVVADDALLALGPHLVDLSRWLSGSEVEGVRALEIEPQVASFDLELTRGSARIRCSSAERSEDLIEIRDGDRVRARRSGGGVVRRSMRRLRRPLGAGGLVRSLALQLEEFARVVRGGERRLLATASDGLAVMLVLDAANRSASAGGAWSEVYGRKGG